MTSHTEFAYYDIKIGDTNSKFTLGHRPFDNKNGERDRVHFYIKTDYDDATYFATSIINTDSFNNIRAGLENTGRVKSRIFYNNENDVIHFSSERSDCVGQNETCYTGVNLHKISVE